MKTKRKRRLTKFTGEPIDFQERTKYDDVLPAKQRGRYLAPEEPEMVYNPNTLEIYDLEVLKKL